MPSIKQLMIKFIGNANLFERLNVKVELILILLIRSFYIKINNDHNHLGNAVSSVVPLFEEKIRDRAVNYNESTQTAIDNCLDNLSDDTVASITKFKHINFHTYRTILLNSWIFSILVSLSFLYLSDSFLFNHSICVTLFY